jgi:hypothetical protein
MKGIRKIEHKKGTINVKLGKIRLIKQVDG